MPIGLNNFRFLSDHSDGDPRTSPEGPDYQDFPTQNILHKCSSYHSVSTENLLSVSNSRSIPVPGAPGSILIFCSSSTASPRATIRDSLSEGGQAG